LPVPVYTLQVDLIYKYTNVLWSNHI